MLPGLTILPARKGSSPHLMSNLVELDGICIPAPTYRPLHLAMAVVRIIEQGHLSPHQVPVPARRR